MGHRALKAVTGSRLLPWPCTLPSYPGMHWKGRRCAPPHLQGAQPMPGCCLPNGKCQLQWHLQPTVTAPNCFGNLLQPPIPPLLGPPPRSLPFKCISALTPVPYPSVRFPPSRALRQAPICIRGPRWGLCMPQALSALGRVCVDRRAPVH